MQDLRPSWTEIIFKTLEVYKQRSHDSQTKYACALVHPETHRIMSIGMNGACPNLYDEFIPNTRPEKYPFMFHAEDSAIFQLVGTGISSKGLHAYIDGFPCIKHDMFPGCLQKLYYNGITNIFVKPHISNMVGSFAKWYEDFQDFDKKCKIGIDVVVIDDNFQYISLEKFAKEHEFDTRYETKDKPIELTIKRKFPSFLDKVKVGSLLGFTYCSNTRRYAQVKKIQGDGFLTTLLSFDPYYNVSDEKDRIFKFDGIKNLSVNFVFV